jgi:hypothetical protein
MRFHAAQVLYELGHRQWDVPALRTLLEALRSQNTEFQKFAVEHEFPEIGRKHMLLNARRIQPAGREDAVTMLLAIEDVTEQMRRRTPQGVPHGKRGVATGDSPPGQKQPPDHRESLEPPVR